MKRPTVLIAGGGTGGHVFPAVAVAEAIEALADADIVFCGTARGMEARVIPARGWRLERLHVEPMKGGGPTRAVRGAVVALRATVRALKIVRAERPSAVLSVGGYAAGPATLAAAILGVPVAILEPNSVTGLANRILAPFAKRAYLAWDETAAAFRKGAVRPFGVPLRAGFQPSAYAPKAGATLHVLVLGGSQGAGVLNERLPDVFARVLSGASARKVRVLHQAGAGRDRAVREAYARAGVETEVVAFIDDVAAAIAAADLVIARAGAGAIAEITSIGRASLLVPFPHAADDHQARNAEALARSGGAVCLLQARADVPALTVAIERLLGDDGARKAMADAARARGRPDAAHQVAKDFLALASIAEHPRRLPPAGASRDGSGHVNGNGHGAGPARFAPGDDARRWN